jgi:hypothetical protein
MSQLSIKTIILDNAVLELIYNININMFKHEISNDTLEDAVLFKKTINKNLINYEKLRYYFKKISKEWRTILTDNFKKLILEFNISYKNYFKEKTEYEKYLIKFSTKEDEKNLFKFMRDLSLDK